MHHYTTHTYKTFQCRPQAQWAFREEIPRLALRFPYLLHQVLAISAFHLAHLSPEDRSAYVMRGSHHRSHAISSMRDGLSGEMTEIKAYALFTTSGFLMASTFVLYTLNDELAGTSCPLDTMFEIIFLLRGTWAIQRAAVDQTKKNPSKSLIDGISLIYDEIALQPVETALKALRLGIWANPELNDEVQRATDSGIGSMLQCMENRPGPRVMTSIAIKTVFHWPMIVESDYIDLLHARHPAALTVFLFYCVIMQGQEGECWFLNGWSSKLVDTIFPLLQHSTWLDIGKWPLQQLGKCVAPVEVNGLKV